MITNIRRKLTGRGFTLVELAIVLAVTGVLFIGLYRLLSGGNQQVKDTATASQQIQLINAVKTFLATTQGQAWMGEAGHNASGSVYPLPLPTVSGCTSTPAYTADSNLAVICNYLPPGFIGAGAGAAATLNPYGQAFNVQVINGTVTSPGTAPASYTFLVYTSNNVSGTSETISDSSGGRISSQIGGDGGFIYSSTNACPVANSACGAYGGWIISLTAAGIGPGIGHIVSRTYYSPEVGSLTPWLARQLMPGDTTFDYNSMHTDLYLGSTQAGAANTFWMGSSNGTGHIDGGVVDAQGGLIRLDTGLISDLTVPVNNVNGSSLNLSVLTPGTFAAGGNYLQQNPLVTLDSGCSSDQLTAQTAGIVYHSPDATGNASNSCHNAMFIVGDVNVNGVLQALSLYSTSFVYQASDIRLKTNIEPMGNAIDDVMRLKPVSYRLKSNGQDGLGFIAQDIEKIYPQLVTKGEGLKAVNYEGLIAPLVSSVQELKRQNDELRQQLRDEEGRERALERKIGQQQP